MDSRLVKTQFHARAHQAVERMESPELILDQILRDMDTKIQRAKMSVIKAIAGEKLLRRQVLHYQQQTDHWQRKAEVALENDHEV